jgi:[phosphatase 2A protein]-leucine-carboxy methyltransferase
MNTNHERHIRATADDVLRAKEATVRVGYYPDPFVFCMSRAPAAANGDAPYRHYTVQPMIKRGTYARVCAMDRAVVAFLNNCRQQQQQNPQIVILGAGKDTLFFRLHNHNLTSPLLDDSNEFLSSIHWYEVDHEDVLREKIAAIERHRELFLPDEAEHIEPNQNQGDERPTTTWNLISDKRHCRWISHDLRTDPVHLIQELNLSTQDSVLFLVECVQMYLPIDSSRSILSAIQQAYPRTATLCCYEPILQSDAFGQMMESNLVQAGIVPPAALATEPAVNPVAPASNTADMVVDVNSTGLLRLRTMEDHLSHLVNNVGFQTATACDMWTAYETILTPFQRRSANKCEFLDELEEFRLIMRHYCFVVATTTTSEDCIGRNLTTPQQSQGETVIVAGRDTTPPVTSMGFVVGQCISKSR